MADLKVSSSELATAIQLSKDIHTELKTTRDTVKKLRKYLDSAKWSGQTRDAFLTYLDLVCKYHKDLNTIMKNHKNALIDLEKSIAKYNDSSEVGTIKGL